MGVPDDANPLNRRLPAEVVSRRRKVEKVEKEEAPVTTDRAQVLAMKPEHRLKWLSKALQKLQEGRMPINTVFDIVTHAKFSSEVSDKIGSKMYRAVRANLNFFSSKQQRFLETECRLVQLFQGTVRSSRKEHQEAREEQEPREAARGAAAASSGDRDEPLDTAGIAALWARMTQLSPMERVEAVEQLDINTKEMLEDFLEARIKRAHSSTGDDAEEAPGAGAAAAPASRSRSKSGGGREAARESRRSRSRSGRGPEKKRLRDRSRSRSEAKGSRRNRDRDEATRRGKKSRGRRGRSSSGRRGRSSSDSHS